MRKGERGRTVCPHCARNSVLIGNIANKTSSWMVSSRPCSCRASKHILPCWMLQSLSVHYQNCLWCFCFLVKCLQQQWLRLNTAPFKRTFSVCLKGRKRRGCPSPVLSERVVCSSRFCRTAGGHKVEGMKGCQKQTLGHFSISLKGSAPCLPAPRERGIAFGETWLPTVWLSGMMHFNHSQPKLALN